MAIITQFVIELMERNTSGYTVATHTKKRKGLLLFE
jgi:hypothetical protein